MSTKEDRERIEGLQGTLDLLILRTLWLGPAHGHAMAQAIEFNSDDRLTPAGRKQLKVETSKWDKLAGAIARILRPAR